LTKGILHKTINPFMEFLRVQEPPVIIIIGDFYFMLPLVD